MKLPWDFGIHLHSSSTRFLTLPFLAAHADTHPASLISSRLSHSTWTTAPLVLLLIFPLFIVLACANSEVQVRLINTSKEIIKKSKERKLKILSLLFSDCMFCGKDLKTIMSTEGESASQISCLFYYLVKRIIACESPPRFRRTWKYFVKRCRTHQ